MADDYTALLLIIDRSGSMVTLHDEMVGALNALLAAQREQPGLLTVDLVQFDNQIDYVEHFADPAAVTIALDPRGGTALFDAVGLALGQFGAAIDALPEHARPATVQVVVVTDGLENSSQEYTAAGVRQLVSARRDAGWDFVFLGANQDAALSAESIGIAAEAALDFDTDAAAVAYSVRAVSGIMSDARAGNRRGFTEEERTGSSRRGR